MIVGKFKNKLIFVLLICLIILIAFLIGNSSNKVFDGQSGGKSHFNVLYLEGPFFSETENNGSTYNYYIAYDNKKISHIIKTKGQTDLPIAGVDFDYSKLPDSKSKSIKGHGIKIASKLKDSLYDYFGDDYVNSLSVSGDSYYLDTTK